MFEAIGFVVIQIVLLVIGGALGIVCLSLVFLGTRRAPRSWRKLFVWGASFLFPVVAVYYLEAGLMFEYLKDPPLYYPLPNGYRIPFVGEGGPEDGYIQMPDSSMLNFEQIHGFQASGDYLFIHGVKRAPEGTVPTVVVSHGYNPLPAKPSATTRFQEIDTRTDVTTDYSSLEELRASAASRGTSLRLITLEDAYREAPRRRIGWKSWSVMIAPLLIVASVLLFNVHQLRKSARVV